jgi:repressor of nif and glnA expression
VSEVLKSLAPRALRQAEIRRALEANGATLSFPSIRYALEQLAARDAARQVGNSKTWRYQKS